MAKPDERDLIQLRVQSLLDLITDSVGTITPSRLLKLTSNLQVHAVAVHILRPEVRRKTARRLILRKANKKYRHLVFIRSMKVRWNTTLAELERAQLLQPAFDAFVAQARKKKWEMSSGDWEFVDKLVKALEATLTDSAKNHEDDEPVLSAALIAGAAVATTYINKALVGDYILSAPARGRWSKGWRWKSHQPSNLSGYTNSAKEMFLTHF
ncbi:hypothetical protein B0H14DRAFT_2564660 [Mycena olivaceomarginata]|nr:hypothetical protein B0H14DRAFT_2564660 [Mycena olivaceomarginata]